MQSKFFIVNIKLELLAWVTGVIDGPLAVLVSHCVYVAIVILPIYNHLSVWHDLGTIKCVTLHLSGLNPFINVFPATSADLHGIVARRDFALLNLMSVDPDSILNFPEVGILTISSFYTNRNSQSDLFFLYNIKWLVICSLNVEINRIISFEVHILRVRISLAIDYFIKCKSAHKPIWHAFPGTLLAANKEDIDMNLACVYLALRILHAISWEF